ncbi:hypothetical protein QR680_000516 [Steinernema hermaphroditum]|uniref:Uncharacterized protein n=1 Tax=Steinernema hermaphroditum TaxID=289476 RepID=A0AA39LEA9_9BILA|nr:hypothetical protein QR680_000516 [Steinernema hermaphroditum]
MCLSDDKNDRYSGDFAKNLDLWVPIAAMEHNAFVQEKRLQFEKDLERLKIDLKGRGFIVHDPPTQSALVYNALVDGSILCGIAFFVLMSFCIYMGWTQRSERRRRAARLSNVEIGGYSSGPEKPTRSYHRASPVVPPALTNSPYPITLPPCGPPKTPLPLPPCAEEESNEKNKVIICVESGIEENSTALNTTVQKLIFKTKNENEHYEGAPKKSEDNVDENNMSGLSSFLIFGKTMPVDEFLRKLCFFFLFGLFGLILVGRLWSSITAAFRVFFYEGDILPGDDIERGQADVDKDEETDYY